jgi:hypothetical protein
LLIDADPSVLLSYFAPVGTIVLTKSIFILIPGQF